MSDLTQHAICAKLLSVANASKPLASFAMIVAMATPSFASASVPLPTGHVERSILGVYELRIPGPGTQFDDPACKSEATAIADNFAKASGAEIIEVDCRRGSANVHDAVIHYAASAPVAIFDADRGIVPIVNQSWAKPEDCAQGLTREVPIFRQHTGLEPFGSWCYVVHGSTAGLRNTYQLAIFAVNPGSDITDLKRMTYAMVSNPPFFPAELGRIAGEMADRGGVDVVWNDAIQGFGLWEIAVAYYSDKEITLSADALGHLPVADECHAKASSLNATWTALQAVDAHFFCTDAGYGVPNLGIMWRHNTDRKDKEFTINRFNTDYTDQSTCEAASSDMVDRLAQKGQVVLAAMCLHKKYPKAGQPLPPLSLTVITKN